MTEYWVSNAKHWCELCKCWLNDTPESRANHERGSGHKLAVQRKLREMRIKAEKEKKEAEKTKAQLARIDAAAGKAYEKDIERLDQEAEPLPPPETPPPQFGSWKPYPQSKYLYNAELKYYHDPATGFYYGGQPPAWTQRPGIPVGALYREQDANGPAGKTIIKGQLPDALKNLGGHRAPVSAAEALASVRGQASTKRVRPGPSGLLSEAEKKEQEERELARKRVASRTASTFGLE